MLKRLLIIFIMLVLGSSFAFAAQIEVTDGAITTAIERQMPVDRVEVYPADYGKLFCFTRIVGAEENTQVTHVWYYQDDEMARVSLSVGSADWRTYSSKRFLPQWAGEWKVVVLDAGQNEITSIPFRLE
jgi:Protein of unknown function (DUF2914)